MNMFDRHAEVLLSRHLDSLEHRPDCRNPDCEGCIEDDGDDQLDEWREELREERRERDW